MAIQDIDPKNSARPNDALIREAFEQPQWYLQGTEYNIKIRAETVREFVNTEKIGSILDIGCGNGSLSAGLINPHNRLTYLDQSQAMLKIASSRVPAELASRVQTINSGFMEAGLEPQSFDLILCVGVLAYVQDRRAFIARIQTLLKPGGLVIVECTDGVHWVSKLVVAYHALRRSLKPVQMRTVVAPSAGVVAAFEDLGFKLSGLFRYSLPLPGVRKLMNQKVSYKATRAVFGGPGRNRNAWAGNECIYCFKRPIGLAAA